MENTKHIDTPMSPSCKLDKDKTDKNINLKLYRGMISLLLYLSASILDIIFSSCMCARFQANTKESLLIIVKFFFKYLKDTQNLGL